MYNIKNSWLTVPEHSDFSIFNIPFGVFQSQNNQPHVATRIGDTVIDLAVLYQNGYFDEYQLHSSIFENLYLNDFIALGKEITNSIRLKIMGLFADNSTYQEPLQNLPFLQYSLSEISMLLPVQIGDYTDFYSSMEHATNVGKMFRDPDNALLPNWKHLPVGYHGRASSIVVSGTAIHRPKGQFVPRGTTMPVFEASRLVDFELEMGYIIGKKTELGTSVSTKEALHYVFGMCLFNDLTARDIQKWEYVPLGPFLGKNFGSVMSPWIVTMEALEPFQVSGPQQEPEVLPYLQFEGNQNYDIQLHVYLQPQNDVVSPICESNHRYLYWNIPQQIAHHTSNGCNMNVGDLYASGTISGSDKNSFGSMLELSWGGSKDIQLKNGKTRKFMEDYDTIILSAFAEKDGKRVGFGECVTQLVPVKE